MSSGGEQRDLFDARARTLEPAEPSPELRALASELPEHLRLGTMSWSYPGWAGHVYRARVSEKALAAHGLAAYAKHPLLRIVEIDRGYYEPLSVEAHRNYAAQTPDDFRFIVKAHEECTMPYYPQHARYGNKRGEQNPRFLDPSYAADAVIAPIREGLGDKVAALLFQFSPQDFGDPKIFAKRLQNFLEKLPTGLTYSVELRRAELLTPDYARALTETGAVHCHNAWTSMPPVPAQAKQIPPAARRPLMIRWLVRSGEGYEDAMRRSAPFDRIAGEDLPRRTAIAGLAAKALAHAVPVLITVNNMAEGCAPESIARLARAISLLRKVE